MDMFCMRVNGDLSSLALVSSVWSLDEVDVYWDCSLENELNCSFDCYTICSSVAPIVIVGQICYNIYREDVKFWQKACQFAYKQSKGCWIE